ncbi:PHP domain protein [Burkholderia cepacia]|uniref:PHP domain protein n=1 Tax=Burkholderia cepacia TaxID=292 RepID=A0AAE8NJL4_BURCE|nr:AAA family ATPase [Burkholderia cepacia]SQA56944.1 PHP domain protein [Burkholderia cepacia]
MAAYEGMRWFKCDFQVQTPEDGAHWSDNDTRLADPRRPMPAPAPDANGVVGPAKPDEQRLQDVARAFLRRCHEVGLELIGVTDHNFSQKTDPRDWFLTHLVEQNKSVARELGRAPLYILPGFEVDIGYHVLCLFEPATKASHVWRINRLLCKLGLDEGERFRQGRPMPLRRNGANVSLKELIELVQEQHKGIVIAAHSDQNDGLLNDPRHMEDYKNQKLMALEVTSNPPSRRVLDIIEGRDRAWARSDCHPAYVMSSDAKSLKQDEHGVPVANSVGYRHTWLKMSKPSIEALRQAFLDPLSRVQLLGPRPSDALTHPRVRKVEVTGAKFLDDQEMHFSESFNCVIGGRGSGKSSLLEYLRFALNHDDGGPEANEQERGLQRKRKQLSESLPVGAEVRVTFEVGNGVSDTLVYRPGRADGPQRWLDGREVADLQTVLRQLQLQFFSQGELSQMTSGAQGQAQVLSLIDAAAGAPLLELNARERELKAQLKALFQSTRDAVRLHAELSEAKQEAVELERQLKAREAVQDDSKQNQLALEARRNLERMKGADAPTVETIEQVLADLVMPNDPLPATAAEWPNAQWFASTSQHMQQARGDLAAAIGRALNDFRLVTATCLSAEAIQPTLDAIDAAQDRFRAACAERGIREDDIARMQELEDKRQAKLTLVEERQKRLADVQKEADKFPQVLDELHAVWKAQFDARSATAAAIQASVASQTVRLATAYMADAASFRTSWMRLAPPDKRGKLARRWDEIGDDLFRTWQQRADASVWETIEAVRQEPRLLEILLTVGFEDLHQALFTHLDGDNVRPLWEDVRISRVSDGIDVQLLRDDGTVAGSMSGALSEGQRNTVLLNLMLARGEGPIVIDQPEDELDSSFIYRTLVRDLRAAKSKRQLIVATHNANLPVNADAEQIYALEARDGRGKALSKGGLDRKDVAQAVLDIMEGSEQAFRRRSEKYHF